MSSTYQSISLNIAMEFEKDPASEFLERERDILGDLESEINNNNGKKKFYFYCNIFFN
jgi:hypothetical protein